MTDPAAIAVAKAIAATWPPAATHASGPFAIPEGRGGGNRVSAARLQDIAANGSEVTPVDIGAVAARQSELGQEALFAVFGWQGPLDAALEAEGYRPRDATDMLCCSVERVAAAPPPVSCFDVWPPLAVQEEIWAEGGIGPARRAIMQRAEGPKTTLFGRIDDRPAGTAFLAVHDGIAMLHALEIAGRSRRKGLARTMVRAAAHWAAHQSATRFAALVTQANAGAQALYASLGLESVGQYHYRVK